MRIALLLAAILVTAPALAADDGQITVRNRSTWEIQELYLSAVDANAWGPDLSATASPTLPGAPTRGAWPTRMAPSA